MKKITLSKSNNKVAYGFLLWSLVLLGYFLFIFNWVSMNTLAGKAGDEGFGWLKLFFDKTPPHTTVQAVNYTITVMRGLGSMGAGFLISKVGHKKAVLIAMALLSVALPTVFMGYIPGQAGYSLFILGRMIMAIGGTVLIVYIQPIISRFFDDKGRAKLSRINCLGFNLGAAIPLIIICIPGAQKFLSHHWQVYAGIISGLPILLLITYFLLAEDIDIKTQSNKNEDRSTNGSTWSSVAKDKRTWKYALYFGGWLTFVVIPILVLKIPFAKLHFDNGLGKQELWEVMLPVIMFLLGLIPGIWLIGWVTKTNVDRRKYIFVVTSISLLSIIGSYLCIAYVKNIAPAAILMFISGMGIWGIQGTSLTIPHEEKNQTPKRISILFGMIWGLGYVIYTIANIAIAGLQDGLISLHASSKTIAWSMLILYIAFSILVPLMSWFLPKTKDGKLSSLFKRA